MTRHAAHSAAPAVPIPGVNRKATIVAFLGLFGCLLWSYWSTIAELCEFWSRNQDYSAGALVPPVAAYLVWRRRSDLTAEGVRPCWWGLAVLGFAELMRQAGVYYGVGSGARFALVVAIVGVVLLAAGARVARKLTWIFLFLFLMAPLPARVHEAIALPLQTKATTSAAIVLELCGFFVMREGNVLRLNEEASVAVAEACSGLRMLTAFVFIAAVLAFLIDRPRWQKLTLVLFSVPIAILSNTIRLVATSVFIYYAKNAALSEKFHDAAGLAMMPLALFFSVLLLRFLAFLGRPAQSVVRSGSVAAATVHGKHEGKRRAARSANAGAAARNTMTAGAPKSP